MPRGIHHSLSPYNHIHINLGVEYCLFVVERPRDVFPSWAYYPASTGKIPLRVFFQGKCIRNHTLINITRGRNYKHLPLECVLPACKIHSGFNKSMPRPKPRVYLLPFHKHRILSQCHVMLIAEKSPYPSERCIKYPQVLPTTHSPYTLFAVN